MEAASGSTSISSDRLARLTGHTAAQVRRDLAYFGNFGKRGVGYSVADLSNQLGSIVGIDHNWNMALIGVGNLGKALLAYRGFEQRGFKIVGAYDNDARKIGSTVSDLTVEPLSKLSGSVKQLDVQLAIIATSAESAQEVLDLSINCGIMAVLNFAPVRLTAPEEVQIANVDLTVEVEYLSYWLTRK